MSLETEFLFGYSMGLVSQMRNYLIKKNDSEGLILFEEDFNYLKEKIESQLNGSKSHE